MPEPCTIAVDLNQRELLLLLRLLGAAMAYGPSKRFAAGLYTVLDNHLTQLKARDAVRKEKLS